MGAVSETILTTSNRGLSFIAVRARATKESSEVLQKKGMQPLKQAHVSSFSTIRKWEQSCTPESGQVSKMTAEAKRVVEEQIE